MLIKIEKHIVMGQVVAWVNAGGKLEQHGNNFFIATNELILINRIKRSNDV